MSVKEAAVFEEDSSSSTSVSSFSRSSETDSSSSHSDVDSSEESSSEIEEEAIETLSKVEEQKLHVTVPVSPPNDTSASVSDKPSKEIPQKSTKRKKSSMTRLQENDLLLSIYDALSSYRRPSSKPSQERKLESIDSAISLLHKLREQLQSQPSTSDSKLATSIPSPHSAATSSTSKKASSSKSEKVPSVKKKKVSEPKAEKAFTNPFQVYCAERRPQLVSEFPELNAAAIRAKMEAEWKVLSAARLEIFCARFQLQVTRGALLNPLASDYQLVENPTSMYAANLLEGKAKPEEACKMCEPSFFLRYEDVPVKKPSHLYWTMRTNVLREDVSKNMQIRMCSALKTSSPFSSVHLARHGKRIVLADTTWAHVYDILGDKNLELKYVQSVPIIWERLISRSLCLSSDGEYLYVGDGDKYLRKWNLQAHKVEVEVAAHKGTILNVSVSPDGRFVATGSSDRHVMLYEADSLKPWKRFGANEDKRLGPKDVVSSVAFSPDSVHVACASLDCSVRVWNIEGGELVKRCDGHEKAVMGICWRTPRDFVSVSLDNTVKHWNLDLEVPSPPYTTPGSPVSIVSDPVDGKALWTAGKDCCIRLWKPPFKFDEEAKEDAYTLLMTHTAPVVDIAIAKRSEDCVLLASIASDGVAALWQYVPI